MHKVLLDVNVIIDFIDPHRQRHQDAVSLLQYLLMNSYDICVTEDMLSTIYYITKNKEKTLRFFEDVILKRWIVLSFGTEVLTQAVSMSLETKKDFEDLLQCLCAKNNGCKMVITNDVKFYNCGITTMTTKTFLHAENLVKSIG